MVRESIAEFSIGSALDVVNEPLVHLGDAILAARDLLCRSGLFGGTAGDVSVRIPGADAILISPLVPFVLQLATVDLLEVTLEGRILHRRARPTSSAKMHLAVYRERSDVHAIVHSRAPFVTLLGICDVPIPPVTVDAIPFSDIPRVAVRAGESQAWPEQVAAALASGPVAALLHHEGMVMLGAEPQEAATRAMALEETARILVLSQLLKQMPCTLPPEVVDTLKQDWL